MVWPTPFDADEPSLSSTPNADAVTTFIPQSVRALIRLADALDRGPWNLLSDREWIRSPLDLARLAAGLIRAALIRACGAKALEISRADHAFSWQLGTHGPAELTDWDTETLTEQFCALPVPPPIPDHVQADPTRAELARCLTAFCVHPVFTHLRATV